MWVEAAPLRVSQRARVAVLARDSRFGVQERLLFRGFGRPWKWDSQGGRWAWAKQSHRPVLLSNSEKENPACQGLASLNGRSFPTTATINEI